MIPVCRKRGGGFRNLFTPQPNSRFWARQFHKTANQCKRGNGERHRAPDPLPPNRPRHEIAGKNEHGYQAGDIEHGQMGVPSVDGTRPVREWRIIPDAIDRGPSAELVNGVGVPSHPPSLQQNQRDQGNGQPWQRRPAPAPRTSSQPQRHQSRAELVQDAHSHQIRAAISPWGIYQNEKEHPPGTIRQQAVDVHAEDFSS